MQETPTGERVQVVHVPEASRYELLVDGERVGLLDYVEADDTVRATHTEVDAARGGRGLGERLVVAALSDWRAEGRTVIAVCPFVRHVLRRHPELDTAEEKPA
ncbi:MAG: acetyltransferase [Acidimicrobiaceae bacterium]|nr:acetyltransferase [Acidimicrobiaceae bacterium]